MPLRPRHTVPVLILALALVVPASAAAISATIGSNLQTAPNVGFGCEAMPQITGIDGTQTLVASGQPDCTWRQTGVFGVTNPDETRFSSVPGDGRIRRVEVRAGANPAPLRFVVIRQLGNVGGTANSQCCFFRSETPEMPLQPNTINTFDVNIPVERNTLNGVRAFDLVGISARSGAGSLPLLETGPHNINTTLTNGAVDVGSFYPRMGSVPNDSGGGRLESGTSGLELTVRWTWVSADDPSLTPSAPVDPGGQTPQIPVDPGGQTPLPPPPPTPPALVGTLAAIKEGRASFALRCAANADCAGAAELLAANGRAAQAATAATTKTKKPVSYGKATYTIKAGRKATVKVKLGAAGRKALRRHRTLAATLKLTPTGGTAVTRKITLRR